MVSTQLHHSLIDGMGDHVVIVRARLESAVEDGFHLESGAHTPEGEVTHPQLIEGELGDLAVQVEHVGRMLRHGAPHGPIARSGSGRRVEATTSSARSRSGRLDFCEKRRKMANASPSRTFSRSMITPWASAMISRVRSAPFSQWDRWSSFVARARTSLTRIEASAANSAASSWSLGPNAAVVRE